MGANLNSTRTAERDIHLFTHGLWATTSPRCGPLRLRPVNSHTLSLLVVHIQKQKGTDELAWIPEQNRAQLEVGPARSCIRGLTDCLGASGRTT